MTDLSKYVKPTDEPLIPGQDWNEFILQSLTPEARDTLSKLSAGTHVLVPTEGGCDQRFLKAPEPVAKPDEHWCQRYADWHRQRYGLTPG